MHSIKFNCVTNHWDDTGKIYWESVSREFLHGNEAKGNLWFLGYFLKLTVDLYWTHSWLFAFLRKEQFAEASILFLTSLEPCRHGCSSQAWRLHFSQFYPQLSDSISIFCHVSCPPHCGSVRPKSANFVSGMATVNVGVQVAKQFSSQLLSYRIVIVEISLFFLGSKKFLKNRSRRFFLQSCWSLINITLRPTHEIWHTPGYNVIIRGSIITGQIFWTWHLKIMNFHLDDALKIW